MALRTFPPIPSQSMDSRGEDRFSPEYEFSLQFFAAEDEGRTEEPTEKKRQEARSEGQVPQTMELPSALVMGAGFLVLWIWGHWMFHEVRQYTVEMMSLQRFETVNPGNAHKLLLSMIWISTKVSAPAALAAMAAGVVGTVSQTGFMFTLQPLKFDLSQLQLSVANLLSETIFSKKMLVNLAKEFVKLFVVGIAAFQVIYSDFDRLLLMLDMPLVHAVITVLYLAFEILAKAILLLLILSPLDYMWERYQHKQNLMMTPQEVEDEQKQREGDPEVKQEQRERQQEAAQRRMMEEVPEADVVITNPTHYAVALSYRESEMEAPRVVAKGKDLTAQRIKKLAREHGVPVYEVPLLARTLYQIDLDEEIPAVLYETVAEVLVWVHEQRDSVGREEAARLEQRVKGIDLAPAG